MKYAPPQFSDKEILEIFPKAKDIIPIKIKENEKAIKEKEQEIKAFLEKVYSFKRDEFFQWFWEEVAKSFFMPDLMTLEKNLFQLKRYETLLNPNRSNTDWHKFEEKLENARDYPIYELARDKLELRTAGQNYTALCPFHNEKTPSFYLYTETNTFHCYGCQEHGDVIKLAMHFYGIEFKEAVEVLQK